MKNRPFQYFFFLKMGVSYDSFKCLDHTDKQYFIFVSTLDTIYWSAKRSGPTLYSINFKVSSNELLLYIEKFFESGKFMQLENFIDVPLIVENGLNLVIKRSPLDTV